MRVAINLLSEDPGNPSGAHWFWTRVIPEMARRLESGEELYLMVSPRSRPLHQDYGPGVRYIAFPWSNERRKLRTLTEHLYAPARLPLGRIDVLNTTGMAPVINPWSMVLHIKTMHAYTEPGSVAPLTRLYRRLNYPRSAAAADAVIINSESLRAEVEKYLDVDARKLRLIYEAVDHELFRPGDEQAARAQVKAHGVTGPYVLFVSSMWPYKNCDGLLRAWALARASLPGRQLVVVGAGRDEKYYASLQGLARELGIASEVVFTGGVPLAETVSFYRAAELLVYPSLNETFGLPILEAMACGCPVVTSNTTAMPETAGGAAVLADPADPASIAAAIAEAAAGRDRLRTAGLRRAAEFTWAATGASTLDVYREAAANRKGHRA
jgi:glycosyltransferase involved in cell wall biosynthesis